MDNSISMQKNLKQLKYFVIRVFVAAILILAILEGAFGLLYEYVIFPVLSFLFSEFGIRIHYYDFSMSFGIIFYLIIAVFSCIIQILPGSIAFSLEVAINHIVSLFYHSEVQFVVFDSKMTTFQKTVAEFVLITVLLFLLVLAVFPYFFVIILFTRLISKKVAEQERSLEKQRNLMLADVAHDLKTPLTTVAGYSQMLLEEESVTKEKQKYMQSIYEKSCKINEMMNLLFEYLKLDSEGFAIKRERTDISEVLRENAALYYIDFEEKGFVLTVDIPEYEVIRYVDKVQFSRAISNLLSNALKHNKTGTHVNIRMEELDDLIIRIADDGEKIPDRIAAHIFEPFAVGDTSRNSKNGSGLGLSISQKILRMHGGDIRLVNKGVKDYTKEFVIYL